MADRQKLLSRMMASCARREHCTSDVREKLLRSGASSADVAFIIDQLRSQKFLDDERYARAFVRDKSRFNAWGKTKIRFHLQHKKIDNEIINQAILEIDQANYEQQLEEILSKKLQQVRADEDLYQLKAKLVRFAAGRGYEPDMIYSVVNRLLSGMTD